MKTNRLYIRPFMPRDERDFLKLSSIPSIQYASCLPVISDEQALVYFHNRLKNPYCFAIIEKSERRFVGEIDILPVSPEKLPIFLRDRFFFEFGIRLLPEDQAKGYGSEAYQFALDYIYQIAHADGAMATYYDKNRASRNLHHKMGFVDLWKSMTPKIWKATGEPTHLITCIQLKNGASIF